MEKAKIKLLQLQGLGADIAFIVTIGNDAFSNGIKEEFIPDNINAAAAVTVTSIGAQTSISSRKEVDEFLK